MANEDLLEQVKGDALKVIHEHFHDNKHSSGRMDNALRTLAAVAKLKATDRAGDATQYTVIRDLAADRKQLAEYVGTSLPHLNPVKKLEKGKG